MKRVRWVRFTANDGHSIGLDSEGRGYEIHLGELARLPDPPAAERHGTSVKTAKPKPSARRRKA